MRRRHLLIAGTALASSFTIPAMAATGDGAPPIPDLTPLENEFDKYLKCPYCGMNRRQWHFSRHLIHYEDDTAEGTCSLRCAAVSLMVNLRRGARIIYAPDNGSGEEIKPLVNAEFATYVIGGDHRAVMTKVPKTPFASRLAAEAARGDGELSDFDGALKLAYSHLVEAMTMGRRRREENRHKAAQPPT
ncbi:twin-arginine translocation pathway signal protein [Paramagnetospirillum kuznetsovii]|uniref:Twin-arginine translocation pathway signal protein n=1 Tax=Paramagnetospirillum kuznetsovii TaxID=2053833 RepID=A0A364NTI0_9PROT|nr:nitrous oxide reductase accessory protein NosL [Paramagnetospirillum kuznetsovii]RAU20320.1 twin-arginine translocation pathway signal protein [Paramagnetospirillum kuznetsovii]